MRENLAASMFLDVFMPTVPLVFVIRCIADLDQPNVGRKRRRVGPVVVHSGQHRQFHGAPLADAAGDAR